MSMIPTVIKVLKSSRRALWRSNRIETQDSLVGSAGWCPSTDRTFTRSQFMESTAFRALLFHRIPIPAFRGFVPTLGKELVD